MRKLLFALVTIALFTGCNSTQKSWIYEVLPEYVWIDMTYDALEQDVDQRTDKYVSWANQAIREYTEKGESEDLDDLITADLFGLSTLYLLGGGSSSAEKKREEAIKEYKNNAEYVLSSLGSAINECYSYRDSSYEVTDIYTDKDFFYGLFGTPDNIPVVNDSTIKNVALYIAVNVFENMERPVITNCEYNKEKGLWVVRMDNADTQYVKFYKRNDGEYDVEYSSKLNKNGDPDSEDTYITQFKGGTKVPSATDNDESILRVVRTVYAEIANEGPNYVDLNKKYCSSGLRKAIDEVVVYDEKNSEGYIGFFDFDYYLMAQDSYQVSISELKVDSANAKTAIVSFNLHNMGEVTPMKLEMVKENGEWKIDNFINAGNSIFNLRSSMREYLTD